MKQITATFTVYFYDVEDDVSEYIESLRLLDEIRDNIADNTYLILSDEFPEATITLGIDASVTEVKNEDG